MKLCTLYIIDCGSTKHNPDRLINSLLGLDVVVNNLRGKIDFSKIHPDTSWKMFLYSSEYLQKSLAEVLPLYLNSRMYDLYSLFQRKVDKTFTREPPSIVHHSPRIFRGNIEMKSNCVQVETMNGIRWTNILDGFIYYD